MARGWGGMGWDGEFQVERKKKTYKKSHAIENLLNINMSYLVEFLFYLMI